MGDLESEIEELCYYVVFFELGEMELNEIDCYFNLVEVDEWEMEEFL